MLSDNDIQKLSKVFATKQELAEVKQDLAEVKFEVITTKNELSEVKKDTEFLRENMQALLVGMDGIAKNLHELRMEYTGMAMQLTRHEKWIKELAGKIGITLND